MLVVLVVEHLLLLFLLVLRVTDVLLHFIAMSSFIKKNFLPLLLLLGLVHESHLSLFVLLLLQPHLLLHHNVLIAAALVDDVRCLLTSLINLLVRSHFLLLQ